MKRFANIASIVLNVVLAGLLIWSHVQAGARAFTLVADAVEAEVRLQEHLLAQLEAEPPETDRVKELLRRNIANGVEIASLWRDAAN
ncbi:MAG: hypothetical protein ACYTFI_19565 [Planctomycetota bacterium]|jgi:hypothetical protein